MIAMIDRLAASFAAKHRNHKIGYVLDPARAPAQKDFVQLLEMVIAYARHVRGCRTDKATALAELTACIADRWTGALHGVNEFLDRTTTMLDSTAVAAIWPSLLRMRQG